MSRATALANDLDDAAEIEAALTTLVRRASLPAAHAAVLRVAGSALDRAAYVVLARIEEWGPLRLSALARRLAIDVSTLSRHVARLEAQGYTKRSVDPSDQRACLLTVTCAGSDAVSRVRRARTERIAELLAHWPGDDRRDLARLLARLAEALSPGDPA